MRYAVKVRKSGNVKSIHNCIGRARLELSQFEEFDKHLGVYTPHSYEIVIVEVEPTTSEVR